MTRGFSVFCSISTARILPHALASTAFTSTGSSQKASKPIKYTMIKYKKKKTTYEMSVKYLLFHMGDINKVNKTTFQ